MNIAFVNDSISRKLVKIATITDEDGQTFQK